MRSRNGVTLLVIRSISFAFGVKSGTFALNLPLDRDISPTVKEGLRDFVPSI